MSNNNLVATTTHSRLQYLKDPRKWRKARDDELAPSWWFPHVNNHPISCSGVSLDIYFAEFDEWMSWEAAFYERSSWSISNYGSKWSSGYFYLYHLCKICFTLKESFTVMVYLYFFFTDVWKNFNRLKEKYMLMNCGCIRTQWLKVMFPLKCYG